MIMTRVRVSNKFGVTLRHSLGDDRFITDTTSKKCLGLQPVCRPSETTIIVKYTFAAHGRVEVCMGMGSAMGMGFQ